MPIHILPTDIASQIAAGEVVERPASVVKELLENSLDAGSSYISVNVEGAGRSLIEVTDDGYGIPAEELELSIERHATSKLNSAADLFHITTLGFRGEALASIGSISRITITSRTARSDVGARLRVEGGRAFPIQSIGSPVGTVVRVENLFYNVPARLKFLKHDTTERNLIDKVSTRYAMAYPHVRFHLTQDNRPVLQTSGNGDRRELLAALYGADIARAMLEVVSEDRGLRITGFISPTHLTRSNRREISFFVNGRPVQDVALSAALLQAYHTLLMVGRYPMAIVFINMPPELVDVNVHPTKAEVRFREPDRIFTTLQSAIRKALLAYSPLPGLEDIAAPDIHSTWGASHPIDSAWQWSVPAPQTEQTEALIPPPLSTLQRGLPSQRPSLLRPIGQVALAYLVAEGPDGLYLIDQHAAHERVLFERFIAQQSERIPSQNLLQPVSVSLPPGSARLVAENLATLISLGYDIEIFGGNTFLIRAIPALLSKSDPEAALKVLVEDFEEDETPFQSEQEARLIARICKRAAVKAGQVLSPEEQRALILDLESCQSPRTCPHGRPTMIHLSVDLLERQFGRKGAH